MPLPRLPLPKTRIALAAAALAAGAGLSPAVLAKAPAGAEFRVNTYTTNSQYFAAVAMDADGDFVVAWSGEGDGDTTGIYARRYNAAGVAQGNEFRVNTRTAGNQQLPAVAMDADGDFVVAWEGSVPAGRIPNGDIYAQRYNAAGVAQGVEFLVNTYTTGNQVAPAIALDTDGDFVIVWDGPGGAGEGIYAQRYNAAGQAQGSEFRVSTTTAVDPRNAAIAISADGDFVVAWVRDGDDPAAPSSGGIYAQRFDAAGGMQGGEFRVNTYTTGIQSEPAVATDADGNFVVVWNSQQLDDPTVSTGFSVHAQRYDAAGAAQGAEFRVNTHTTGSQSNSAISLDADGDFVVSWQSYGQDSANSNGVYAQRYNAAGVAQGSEVRVNTHTTGSQSNSAIALDADGDFVISWHSSPQDGNGYGVYAQRYNAAGVAQGSEFRVNTLTTNNQNFSAIAMDADGDFVVSWQSNGQDGNGYGVYAQRYQAVTLTPSLTVTTSGATTNTTPVAGGPGGTYSFNAQFCNNTAQTMTGLSSKTLTLGNNNNLLNRSRDAFAAPGAAAIRPAGPGTEKDVSATNGYADLALANGECVTVPYQIGLTNRNQFNFTVRIRGDNGL